MACSLPALTVWESTERVLHRQAIGGQSPCPHSVKKHRTHSPQAGHRRAVSLPSQCEKAQNAFSTGRASAGSLPALTVWKSTERILHRQGIGGQSPCPHSVKRHRTRSPQAGHRRAVSLPSQCEKAQNAFSTGRASAGSLPALTVWKGTERVLHRQGIGGQSPCPHSVRKHRMRSPQAGHRQAVSLPSQCEKAQNAFSTGRASAGSLPALTVWESTECVLHRQGIGRQSWHNVCRSPRADSCTVWSPRHAVHTQSTWQFLDLKKKGEKRNTVDAGRWVSLHNTGKSVRGFNTSYCKLTDSTNLLGKGGGGGGAAVNPKGTCLFYCYFCPFHNSN